MFGWKVEEVLGGPLPTIPEGEEAEFRSLLESELHGAPYREAAVRRRRKDGSLLDVRLWMAPMHDANGAVGGVMVILADITAQLQAERERAQLMARGEEARAQAQLERRFRELLEAAPDGILEVDSAGRIVLLNQVAEKMFGYSREELLGERMETLVPEDSRERHSQHRANYQAHPQTRPMGTGLHLEARRKDGTRFPVEISLSPVKSDGEFRVSAIIRDVTERKQAEERIRAIHEKFTRDFRRPIGSWNCAIRRSSAPTG